MISYIISAEGAKFEAQSRLESFKLIYFDTFHKYIRVALIGVDGTAD